MLAYADLCWHMLAYADLSDYVALLGAFDSAVQVHVLALLAALDGGKAAVALVSAEVIRNYLLY
jgi:hypothetical protein